MEVFQEVKPNKLLQFEVMSIKSERKENGNSLIELKSVEEDPIIFTLALPSINLDNITNVKRIAINKYEWIVAKREADREYKIKVGTIL